MQAIDSDYNLLAIKNNIKLYNHHMSKRNYHIQRNPPPHPTSKAIKNHSKSNSFHMTQHREDNHNGLSKQVQSRLEYINLKQQTDINVNRLDLIFQKQPKEIQDKLMKLLISYNAILQYNKNTDLFEVDLLLPFLSEQEKREFIKQFLDIRKNKSVKKNDEKSNDIIEQQAEGQLKRESTNNKSNNTNQSKQIRKFSFNNNFSSQFEQQIEHKEDEMIDQLHYEEEQIQQEKKKIVFLPQEYNRYRTQHQNQTKTPLNNVQNKGLDLKKIEETISQRLKNAISIISRKKGKQQKDKQNDNNSKSIYINEEQTNREESIIEKFSDSNQFSQTQKYSENSNYIKEDVGDTEQPSQQKYFGRNNFDEYNLVSNYQSETHKYREVIQQQQEEQEYQPLFKQKEQKPKKNEKVTSFEDYTKKYTTLKQDKNKNKQRVNKVAERTKQDNQVNVPKNYFSSKEKDQHRKSEKMLNNQKSEKKVQERNSLKNHPKNNQQRSRSRQSSSHSRSRSSYKQSPSKQSQQIKQHLNDFFNQHKQNLQSLYSEIKTKIKAQTQSKVTPQKPKQAQKQKPPQKITEDLYILVLDDLQQEQSQNTSTAQIPNSKQFKSQMIKQYKKEILINSKHLSSQDLIRYFRFLHANAKKLYLKYLTNKQK